MALVLFAGTIFCSAFLLFLIQPIASKHILPWFGGSAAVWAICMSFFQALLLAGYAYADWTSRRWTPARQVLVHALLLAVGLATLRVLADPSWKPLGDEDPSLRILLMLLVSIGLPYFLLSSTGPLVQSWVARSVVDARVYRLFSLSNLASLLGLLAYPFLIEPRFTLGQQAQVWTAVYAVFSALCVAAAITFLRRIRTAAPHDPIAARAAATAASASGAGHSRKPAPAPTAAERWRWFTLSALGSALLVAVTNHLTRDVAAIPFLWIVPLVLYLLTFVICFESDRWYRPGLWRLPLLALTAACAYSLWAGSSWTAPAGGSSLPGAIAVFSAGLFVQCVFLHGELASRRPAGEHLTRFYLMLSLGGAVGGALVSLVAPRILPSYYELGVVYVLVMVVVLRGVWRSGWLSAGLAAVTALACAVFAVLQVRDDASGARILVRNFYGTLATADLARDEPLQTFRRLFHGSVNHGEQFLHESRRREPTTYYGPTSGMGRAIAVTRRDGQRVGVIGLGAGVTAVYGRPGDEHRFYEINPQVVDIARTEFSFLRDTRARTQVLLGDARLVLERETPNGFDVLAVDAFSGDSVPVHLMTREALALYLRHVRPDGIVAFHVTNRHLQLAPVVRQLAQDAGALSILVHDEAQGSALRRTDWVLVTRRADLLGRTEILEAARPFPVLPGLGVWTDDFNNLFEVLR